MTPATTWMPFYIADYLRDTMHLSRDEHGAYFLLLIAAWVQSGSLQNDPKFLAAITKSTPKEWRRLAPSVLPFFRIEGDKLVHSRVRDEWNRAQSISETRRNSGLLGGRPKKQTETNGKAHDIAN